MWALRRAIFIITKDKKRNEEVDNKDDYCLSSEYTLQPTNPFIVVLDKCLLYEDHLDMGQIVLNFHQHSFPITIVLIILWT